MLKSFQCIYWKKKNCWYKSSTEMLLKIQGRNLHVSTSILLKQWWVFSIRVLCRVNNQVVQPIVVYTLLTYFIVAHSFFHVIQWYTLSFKVLMFAFLTKNFINKTPDLFLWYFMMTDAFIYKGICNLDEFSSTNFSIGVPKSLTSTHKYNFDFSSTFNLLFCFVCYELWT